MLNAINNIRKIYIYTWTKKDIYIQKKIKIETKHILNKLYNQILLNVKDIFQVYKQKIYKTI